MRAYSQPHERKRKMKSRAAATAILILTTGGVCAVSSQSRKTAGKKSGKRKRLAPFFWATCPSATHSQENVMHLEIRPITFELTLAAWRPEY